MSDASTYVRPMPPASMQSPMMFVDFQRASEVEDFVQQHFLSRDGIFFDPEHGHLTQANIGIIWAGSKHIDKGSVKAGTAQLLKGGEPSKWGEAMRYQALLSLFDLALPEFLITLSGPVSWTYDDRQFFALVDHELSHCAVATGPFGEPRFNNEGRPVWSMRPHDHEGFAGTTERWGAEASGASSLVQAGLKEPRFKWVPGKDLDVRKACGTP